MANNPAQIIASAPGVYPVPLNLAGVFSGAGVGLLITVPNGVTVSYTVEVSGDPQNGTPTNFNPHDTLGTTQTASANGNLSFPVTWVALNVTAISGGSIVMNVVQAQVLRPI